MYPIGRLAHIVKGLKNTLPATCRLVDVLALALREDSAPAWNAETKYHKGDLVSFETVLYRAKRDVPRNPGCAPGDQNFWEIVDTSAKEAMKKQVEEMLRLCRNLCCGYDNLKALVGRLEAEAGVAEPQFYAGPLNKTGDPVKCRQCERLA